MATSYANIGGAGNRLALIVGSVSGITWNPGDVTLLLNGVNSSGANVWNTAAASGAWLKFDLLYPAIIDEAKWYQSGTTAHGVWKWQGSNDDSNWTDIGSSFTFGGATTQTQTQLNGNTTAYRYYRLLGVSGNMSWIPYLYEIEFKITYNANGITPAYGNALSIGDRTATITLTSDIGKLAGNYTDLINGLYSNQMYFSGGTVSGHYIKLDFGVAKIVDEAKWRQSNASNQGTWKWQGSNNNSSWSDIGSSFTLGGATIQVQTELNGNTTGYRYYRLLGVSGNTSTSPYVLEIEFRIGNATHTYNLTTVCAAISTSSSPLAAIARLLASPPAAVSTVAAPILAITRALQASVAAGSVTSDILLLNTLITAIAAQSQVSSPALNMGGPLNTAIASQTYVPNITLKVLRNLATAIYGQSAESTPGLDIFDFLTTAVQIITGTSGAVEVLRSLATTIAAQSALPDDIYLNSHAYRDLITAIAAQTQTSILDVNLAVHESLLAKAKRYFGSPVSVDLKAAAMSWAITEEKKEQHLPGDQYNDHL